MFKKDFFLCIKNVQLKYVSSKAQINNTDYNINYNIMIMIIIITIIKGKNFIDNNANY